MPEKTNKLPDNPVARIRMRLSTIRGERVTQADLAEELGVAEKYISMIETGSRKTSYRLAQKILKIAPVGTRIEWIMGVDNFETEEDLLNHECIEAKEHSDRMGIMEAELLNKIAATAGYRLERKHLSTDEFLRGDEGYIFIDNEGNEYSLGYFGEYGIQDVWFDFFDYAAFRLKRTIEKKYNKARWYIRYGDEEEDKNG